MTVLAQVYPARNVQACANCDAWLPNKAANPAAGQPRQGWCRGNLPSIITIMAPGHSLAAAGPQLIPMALNNQWPPVTADQWCRAWAPEDDDDGSKPAA